MDGGGEDDVALQLGRQRPDQGDAADRQDFADVEHADLGFAAGHQRDPAGDRLSERELRLDDLKGSAGVLRLKEELLRRVNVAAAPYKVRDVLLKEMIVQ